MRPLKSLFASVLFVFAGAGAWAQDGPRVVSVNYPLQYFAQQLLGDAAKVDFLVPADVDPSFWRPSVADISAIQATDLILLNGAGFATWVDRVSLPRAKLVDTSAVFESDYILTESITHSHGEGSEHSHEGIASYTWLDPSLAAAQAEAIAAAVIARGIGPEDDVRARLAGLRVALAALDAQAAVQLADVAEVPMIATHPRYQYFARRYGLSIAALEWDAGAMPNDADIATLRALIAQTGAQVLIWEAAPPAGAFEITAELGLENVVFPTLAQGVEGVAFPEAFAKAVNALSEAASR